jgi:biotin transport system substrate-specific component
MTTLTQSITRSRRLTLLGIVGFAAALAAASQVAVPIPGTPVPFTLQPLVVVLAGMWLGPAAGAWSMLLYLAVGATGLPVFAPVGAPGVARFFGPTGGYLIAYPAGAYVAGVLSRRADTLGGRWLAALVGIALLFVGGIAQLTLITGSFSRAVQLGITPFAAFDIVKAWIAAAITGSRAREGPPRLS